MHINSICYDRFINNESYVNKSLEYFEQSPLTSYKSRYYEFYVTKRRDGNQDMIQVAELKFFDENKNYIPMSTFSITNPSGNNPYNETPDKLIDNNINTKWLDYTGPNTSTNLLLTYTNPNRQTNSGGYVIIDFGEDYMTKPEPFYYTWYTANDHEERDPVSWEIQSVSNNNCGKSDQQYNYPVTTDRNTDVSNGKLFSFAIICGVYTQQMITEINNSTELPTDWTNVGDLYKNVTIIDFKNAPNDEVTLNKLKTLLENLNRLYPGIVLESFSLKGMNINSQYVYNLFVSQTVPNYLGNIRITMLDLSNNPNLLVNNGDLTLLNRVIFERKPLSELKSLVLINSYENREILNKLLWGFYINQGVFSSSSPLKTLKVYYENTYVMINDPTLENLDPNKIEVTTTASVKITKIDKDSYYLIKDVTDFSTINNQLSSVTQIDLSNIKKTDELLDKIGKLLEYFSTQNKQLDYINLNFMDLKSSDLPKLFTKSLNIKVSVIKMDSNNSLITTVDDINILINALKNITNTSGLKLTLLNTLTTTNPYTSILLYLFNINKLFINIEYKTEMAAITSQTSIDQALTLKKSTSTKIDSLDFYVKDMNDINNYINVYNNLFENTKNNNKLSFQIKTTIIPVNIKQSKTVTKSSLILTNNTNLTTIKFLNIVNNFTGNLDLGLKNNTLLSYSKNKVNITKLNTILKNKYNNIFSLDLSYNKLSYNDILRIFGSFSGFQKTGGLKFGSNFNLLNLSNNPNLIYELNLPSRIVNIFTLSTNKITINISNSIIKTVKVDDIKKKYPEANFNLITVAPKEKFTNNNISYFMYLIYGLLLLLLLYIVYSYYNNYYHNYRRLFI